MTDSPTELSQEEKRVKIAEACGWTKCRLTIKGAGGGTRWPTAHGIPPGRGYEAPCPDYFNDLNAMHKAETKVLSVDRKDEYGRPVYSFKLQSNFFLNLLVSTGHCEDYDEAFSFPISRVHGERVVSATADERAEAFGQTLNLW